MIIWNGNTQKVWTCVSQGYDTFWKILEIIWLVNSCVYFFVFFSLISKGFCMKKSYGHNSLAA